MEHQTQAGRDGKFTVLDAGGGRSQSCVVQLNTRDLLNHVGPE